MRTRNKIINFQHSLGDLKFTPAAKAKIDSEVLEKMMQITLDAYLESDYIPLDVVEKEVAAIYGDFYATPGYYLKIFRARSGLTQKDLASKLDIKQHHLSEMENNKRSIGKNMAKKIAACLDCDYKDFI